MYAFFFSDPPPGPLCRKGGQAPLKPPFVTPPFVGIIERGVLQAYVRARASSTTLCSVYVLRSFYVFSISKRESDTYQNGLGYMSDTYPNPYPPVTHGMFFTPNIRPRKPNTLISG